MRKGDPQGPTRTGLPNTMGPCQPLEGRWCSARRVPEGLCAWRDVDLIPCGGELLYRRRREAGLIVTYLVCQFCGQKKPMLSCDVETLQHTDLTAEPLTPGHSPDCHCWQCGQAWCEANFGGGGEELLPTPTAAKIDLAAEPAHITLSRRACDFCGRLKLPDELMIGGLRGRPGFGIGCKGGCTPKGSMQE